MSPELRKFLTDWLAWVEAGAPQAQPFTRYAGLCYNASTQSGAVYWEIIKLLRREFDGRSDAPFHKTEMLYCAECDNGEAHLNPVRLAWVRQKLEMVDAA